MFLYFFERAFKSLIFIYLVLICFGAQGNIELPEFSSQPVSANLASLNKFAEDLVNDRALESLDLQLEGLTSLDVDTIGEFQTFSSLLEHLVDLMAINRQPFGGVAISKVIVGKARFEWSYPNGVSKVFVNEKKTSTLEIYLARTTQPFNSWVMRNYSSRFQSKGVLNFLNLIFSKDPLDRLEQYNEKLREIEPNSYISPDYTIGDLVKDLEFSETRLENVLVLGKILPIQLRQLFLEYASKKVQFSRSSSEIDNLSLKHDQGIGSVFQLSTLLLASDYVIEKAAEVPCKDVEKNLVVELVQDLPSQVVLKESTTLNVTVQYSLSKNGFNKVSQENNLEILKLLFQNYCNL